MNATAWREKESPMHELDRLHNRILRHARRGTGAGVPTRDETRRDVEAFRRQVADAMHVARLLT